MRGARALGAGVVGAVTLSLVTTGAGPVQAAAATVTRGDFAVVAGAPAGTALAGRAQLVRGGAGPTQLTVHLTGLAKGATYGVHLHTDTCAAALGHYKDNLAGASTPPNELWASSDPASPQAGVKANAAGIAEGRGVAPWRARDTAKSVVIHADTQHGGTTAGGPRLACADLR